MEEKEAGLWWDGIGRDHRNFVVVMIGDKGVGKSSLARCLLNLPVNDKKQYDDLAMEANHRGMGEYSVWVGQPFKHNDSKVHIVELSSLAAEQSMFTLFDIDANAVLGLIIVVNDPTSQLDQIVSPVVRGQVENLVQSNPRFQQIVALNQLDEQEFEPSVTGDGAKIISVSARTGQNVPKIWDAVFTPPAPISKRMSWQRYILKKNVRIAILGAEGMGKSTLSFVRKTGKPSKKPVKSIESWSKKTKVDGEPVRMICVDASADKLSAATSPLADVYFICCSVRDRRSLHEANKIENHIAKAHVGLAEPVLFLVATKTDLRDSPSSSSDSLPSQKKKTKSSLTSFLKGNNRRRSEAPIERSKDESELDWLSLPEEVALHILSYLDPPELGRAACVCNLWKTLAKDDSLPANIPVSSAEVQSFWSRRGRTYHVRECSATTKPDEVKLLFDDAVRAVWVRCPRKRVVACSLY